VAGNYFSALRQGLTARSAARHKKIFKEKSWQT
jgi:hypothetical protein